MPIASDFSVAVNGDIRHISGTARYTVGILSDSLAWKKAELFATVLAPGVAGLGAVRKHPDMLEAAYRAGRKAVEAASS